MLRPTREYEKQGEISLLPENSYPIPKRQCNEFQIFLMKQGYEFLDEHPDVICPMPDHYFEVYNSDSKRKGGNKRNNKKDRRGIEGEYFLGDLKSFIKVIPGTGLEKLTWQFLRIPVEEQMDKTKTQRMPSKE
ncbi:hypothetical protein GF378_02710 [Candidatus Pacearchaeota archaeon]|nr:hypothetical protein [Candidatus Pacearchaeota archaeon]